MFPTCLFGGAECEKAGWEARGSFRPEFEYQALGSSLDFGDRFEAIPQPPTVSVMEPENKRTVGEATPDSAVGSELHCVVLVSRADCYE